MLETVDLAALVAGERRAWDRFVPAATAVAQAAIRRVLAPAGRAEDTPDVVQEVFLRLLKDDRRLLRRFDPARAGLATYLAMIAATAALDRLRRPVPEPAGSAADLETSLPAVPPPSPTGDRLDLPEGLLSPRQTLVLQLTVARDLTPAEAGRLLGISEQTVRSLRHKALERLRRAERSETAP